MVLGYLHSPAKIHHTWASGKGWEVMEVMQPPPLKIKSKSSPLLCSIDFAPLFLTIICLPLSLCRSFNIFLFMATEMYHSVNVH